MERRAISVHGVVQGVGFRPFVYGLASRLHLSGFVTSPAGVVTEVEADRDALERFERALTTSPAPLARVDSVSTRALLSRGDVGFRIDPSRVSERSDVFVCPDVATCDACLAELFDPSNRRHCYPFINCTVCGPRLTIVTGTPYDRERTTMALFEMCEACRSEYEDPRDRRFHAEPIACPACGPRVTAMDGSGRLVAGDSMTAAARALASGHIVAVKGLGGFHLACDAANGDAIGELRRRKRRDDKPFAVMVESLVSLRDRRDERAAGRRHAATRSRGGRRSPRRCCTGGHRAPVPYDAYRRDRRSVPPFARDDRAVAGRVDRRLLPERDSVQRRGVSADARRLRRVSASSGAAWRRRHLSRSTRRRRGAPRRRAGGVDHHMNDIDADAARFASIVEAVQSPSDETSRLQMFELLEHIDHLHRTCVSRLFELITELGGKGFVERIAEDPAVKTLFVLYDLVPNDPLRLVQSDVAMTPPNASGFIPLRKVGGRAPAWKFAFSRNDLPRGVLKAVEIDGVPVLLCALDDEDGIVAYRNACPGSALPLHLGSLSRGELHCPWHGCRFEIASGRRIGGSGLDLEPFNASVREGVVHVAMNQSPEQTDRP